MKVLLFDTTNAFLTPGGKAVHAIKLQQELSKIGVEIEFSRWWDKSQENCDLIHFLTPNTTIAKYAKLKGKKTFLSMIFDFESSKTAVEQKKNIFKNRFIDKLPGVLSSNAYWKSFPYMDTIQFMHKYDRNTALKYFPKLLPESKTIIIPHAYDPTDMNISNHLNIKDLNYPSKYLISCANISERKQSILLAKYAKKAKVPVVFLGSASVNDPYYKRFQTEIDNQYVFYPGYVSKEWKDCIESQASGYVLLSTSESGCIAVYEAAAYKIPLLLSDLPWAWGYDSPTDISFCDYKQEEKAIRQLEEFYYKSEKMNHTPFHIMTWSEVASLYKQEYYKLLK